MQKAKRLGCLPLFCVSVAIGVVGLALAWFTHRLPKDGALMSNFAEHKGAYETVVAMARTEACNVDLITATESEGEFDSEFGKGWLEKSIAPQHVSEYRKLLREIGIRNFVAIWTPGQQVMFFNYNDSLVGKGICYWDREPSEKETNLVFASLDDRKSLPGGLARQHLYLRPITGRWCVFLEVKD